MAFNFLAPENSLAGTLNKQNIDMAKSVFALPTERPVFTSFGGMRKPEAPQPDDETFDELDTTKMTDEERRRLNTGAPAVPRNPDYGGIARGVLQNVSDAAGQAVSALPQLANVIPQVRATPNALLPVGMRRVEPPAAPAAPQQAAPQPQTPVAPVAQPAQRPAAPTVQQPAAQGMRAAPRLNALGEPVQTLDQQGGYKVYGPGGAVATEIPWNPTDESALRRTLTRDEYLASQNTPGFAEGARTAATLASQERQQQTQADAAREAAGMRLQGTRESATAESRAATSKDAAKVLDQLSPVIMGHYDQKGEKVPGAIDSGEEEAAAAFKQITSDAGLPATILAGKQLRFDPERGIMQILDEKDNVLEEGSPTGLAKGMFNRYYGGR